MKRVISSVIIMVIMLNIGIFVQATEDSEEIIKGVHTEGIIDDGEKQAEMLKALGLFKGTPDGFELDRGLKRVEAAVMLVRLLSAEEQVLNGEWSHPFLDVPHWADPYVGWLYQSGLTKGISATEYGSFMNTTFEQYALFLRRAQANDDRWIHTIATEEEAKMFSENNNTFTRYTAVTLTTRFLTLTYYRNGNWTYNMTRYFMDKGNFSVEKLVQESEGVISPTYTIREDGKIKKRILEVEVLSSTIGNMDSIINRDALSAYFYAVGYDGDTSYLYQINRSTLEETLILTRDANKYWSWGYEYATSIDGVDYIFETDREEKQSKLLAIHEQEVSESISNLILYKNTFNPSEDDNYFTSEGVMVVAKNDGYYYIDNQEVKFHSLDYDTRILHFDGTYLITESIDESMTKISCINAKNNSVINTYSVLQDHSEPYERRSIKHKQNGEFYGEAGYYVFRNDRLIQITDRATLDVIHNNNNNGHIILIHEPGVRIHTMFGNGGNEIVLIDEQGNEKILLSDVPEHGIHISGFSDEATEEDILFESSNDVGMMHANVYSYKLLPSKDIKGNYDEGQAQILVVDYLAGRPEVEAEGYVEKNKEREQEFLDAAGY